MKKRELTFYAAESYALDDESGKTQVNNDHGENGECDQHVYLTHVKLQPVSGTKSGDHDGERLQLLVVDQDQRRSEVIVPA